MLNDSSPLPLLSDFGRIVDLTQNQVSKICHPLFKKTPISHFSYAKMYDNGKMMYFDTYPDLAVKLYKLGTYSSFEELNLFKSFGLKTTLLSTNMPLPLGSEVSGEKYEKMILLAAELSLHYGFFIVDRGLDCFRICYFGTHISKYSIINFYLNAVPLLERFINYFEYQARDLIEGYHQDDLISLVNYHQKLNLEHINSELSFEIPRLDFSMMQGQYSHNNKIFTDREYECLSLIAQGYTMKTTARKLQISHRTVEQHLRNLKDKLGVNTKNQLVEVWHMHCNNNRANEE